MSQVQFTGTNVLFFADQVSFCSAYCVCGTPPPPPDPVETRTCATCASPLRCEYCPICTPTVVSVAFNSVTLKTSCVLCDSGHSVKITAGTLTGPFTLTQDPQNPCRWSYDKAEASLVASGTDSGDCTGTAIASTTLRIRLERDETGATLTAALVIPNDASEAEFVLFAARADFDGEIPLNLVFTQSTTDDTYCTDWETQQGGKLGYGGTASVTLCPAPVIPCACTDTSLSMFITGLTIPSECVLCPPAITPVTDSIQLTHTGSCAWSAGPITVGTCDGINVAIVFDADGLCGCGYYLTATVASSGDIIGVWFRTSDSPKGAYALCDDYCPGLPATINVDDNPPDTAAPTSCPDGQPTAVMVTVPDEMDWAECYLNPDGSAWDGVLLLDPLTPCSWKAYLSTPAALANMPGDHPLYQVLLRLDTDADGTACWVLEIYQDCTSPTLPPLLWSGRKYRGRTPQGEYINDLGGRSSTPFSIVVS